MTSLNLAKNIIEKSQNIFIFPAQAAKGDNLGASFGLCYSLKKIGKNAKTFIEKIPSRFGFLADSQLNLSKNFTISIDTLEKEILEMSYEKNERALKIYLTLNGKDIETKDISFATSDIANPASGFSSGINNFNQKPDLLITLGAKNLEELGVFFEKKSELFYETPILNIDNQMANENFGEVNLIEIKSCSLSEIVVDLIKTIDENLFDRNAATSLLTGIITASSNFQNPRIRPKLFESASFLLEKGAEHQKIIQHLYKTKSLSHIKLLGLFLKKINFDEKKELYSVCLRSQDFESASASPRDLGSIIEDLKFNFFSLVFPSPNLLLLWESRFPPQVVRGIFYSSKTDLIEKILENFEGTSKGDGVLFSIRENNLYSALQKVLEVL